MAKKKTPAPKKKTSALQTTLVCSAVALAFVAVVLVCMWCFRPGPLDRVKQAGANTIFAENFTADFDLEINGEVIDGIINAEIDPQTEKMDVFFQFSNNVADYEGGIQNNTFVIYSSNTDSLYKEDIKDRVTQFFTLLNGGEPDWSVLLDLSGTDLHEAISKDFEFDLFMECLGKWLNNLNNADWAEKNAGFTKETADGVITYRYTPNPYTLALETAPIFKKAFRDKNRYAALNDYLENAQFLLSNGKADFSFSMKAEQLINTQFHLKYLNTEVKGNCDFIGIGSTYVDKELVAMYINDAS